MFELKKTETSKVLVKGLSLEDGKIIDIDGVERDLNKIVLAAFNTGDVFDFTVQSKDDDTQTVEEDGDSDE